MNHPDFSTEGTPTTRIYHPEQEYVQRRLEAIIDQLRCTRLAVERTGQSKIYRRFSEALMLGASRMAAPHP